MQMEDYKIRLTQSVYVLATLVASFIAMPSIQAAKDYPYTVEHSIVAVENDTDREIMARFIAGFNRHPEIAQALVERAYLYFPTIEKELMRKNLPLSLKVLPLIESSFRTTVSSRAGAQGLWQLMPATAREMGLRISRSVDERCDPAKSTKVAMKYIEYLYDTYGDWSLTLAAYNCGPGRVDRAIKANQGVADFEGIKRFLPRETREYIPKVAAAQYVFDNLEEWGYHQAAYDRDLQLTTLVTIRQKISLEELADVIGFSLESIEILNPSFRRGYIPESSKGYEVRIPTRLVPTLTSYINTGDAIESSLKTFVENYRLKRNTTVFDVAKQLNANPFDIMLWNGISSTDEELKAGTSIRHYVIDDPVFRIDDHPRLRLRINSPQLIPGRLEYRSLLEREIKRQRTIQSEMLAFQLHSN